MVAAAAAALAACGHSSGAVGRPRWPLQGAAGSPAPAPAPHLFLTRRAVVPIVYLFCQLSPMVTAHLWEFVLVFGAWYLCNRCMMIVLHSGTEGGSQELWRGAQAWVWMSVVSGWRLPVHAAACRACPTGPSPLHARLTPSPPLHLQPPPFSAEPPQGHLEGDGGRVLGLQDAAGAGGAAQGDRLQGAHLGFFPS